MKAKESRGAKKRRFAELVCSLGSTHREIDDAVVAEACRVLRRTYATGPNLPVMISSLDHQSASNMLLNLSLEAFELEVTGWIKAAMKPINREMMRNNIGHFVQISFEMPHLYWHAFSIVTTAFMHIAEKNAEMAIQHVGDMLVCALTKCSRDSSKHVRLPLSTFYSGCTHSLIAALNQPCTPSAFKQLNAVMQLTFEMTVSDDHDVSEARHAWALGMQRLAGPEALEATQCEADALDCLARRIKWLVWRHQARLHIGTMGAQLMK